MILTNKGKSSQNAKMCAIRMRERQRALLASRAVVETEGGRP